MNKANLEQNFITHWGLLFPTLPRPAFQFRFHETRKWRFDFAWIEEKLAVEIDGGSFVGGAHGRATRRCGDHRTCPTS